MLARLLRLLRRALLTGALFTGTATAWFALVDHDPGGTALYGLLCLLCVAGLVTKTAADRTH